jgi:CHAD domain-containing protein
MAYRLKKSEMKASDCLPPGVKRIAYERIDDALAYLESPDGDLDVAVHESRKNFKKLRGLLRLVRREIGEKVYKRENACFRDAGRLLSDLRDSAVRIRTLDKLGETYNDELDDKVYATARESLVHAHDETRQRLVVEGEALVAAAEAVRAARARVDSWPIEESSFAVFAGGLRKIYKRGRNRLDDAQAEPAAEVLHEWRKRVKYLWYSVRILRPIWPKPMRALANEVHDLADTLGDEHDLAELQALVEERPALLSRAGARDTLFSVIGETRSRLQQDAFRQGHRIYPERPTPFVKRFRAYWEASQT